MDKLKLYPILLADPIQDYNKNKSYFYIFNSQNNRGYKLDGFAANLCHRFNGIKSLEQVIKEFEIDMDLKSNYFNEEIDVLLTDLQKNSLIEFHNSPQTLKER
jgi:hypothetical protein